MNAWLWWLVAAAIFGLAALLAIGLAQAAAAGDRIHRRRDDHPPIDGPHRDDWNL